MMRRRRRLLLLLCRRAVAPAIASPGRLLDVIVTLVDLTLAADVLVVLVTDRTAFAAQDLE